MKLKNKNRIEKKVLNYNKLEEPPRYEDIKYISFSLSNILFLIYLQFYVFNIKKIVFWTKIFSLVLKTKKEIIKYIIIIKKISRNLIKITKQLINYFNKTFFNLIKSLKNYLIKSYVFVKKSYNLLNACLTKTQSFVKLSFEKGTLLFETKKAEFNKIMFFVIFVILVFSLLTGLKESVAFPGDGTACAYDAQCTNWCDAEKTGYEGVQGLETDQLVCFSAGAVCSGGASRCDNIGGRGYCQVNLGASATCDDYPEGTCVGSTGYCDTNCLYTTNGDSSSAACTCRVGSGHYVTALGTWTGANYQCCGDDTTTDDFSTYSGNLASSTTLNCDRCANGVDASTSSLCGNGYFSSSNTLCTAATKTTATSGYCYTGDITCSYSSAANGAVSSLLYGNGYTSSNRATATSLVCYYTNINCADGSASSSASGTYYGNGYLNDGADTCYYGDITCSDESAANGTSEICEDSCVDSSSGGSCVNTHAVSSAETCYYTETCTDVTGCGYSSNTALRQYYCDTCAAGGVTTGDYCPTSGTSSTNTCYYGTQSCTSTTCNLNQDTSIYAAVTWTSCDTSSQTGTDDYCLDYSDDANYCYYQSGDSCDATYGWGDSGGADFNRALIYGDGDGEPDIVSGYCYYGTESCASTGATNGASEAGPASNWVNCDASSQTDSNMYCVDYSTDSCYYQTTDACDTDVGWDYTTDSACYGDLDGEPDIVSGYCYYGPESCTASGCTDGTREAGPASNWVNCDASSQTDSNMYCVDYSTDTCYYQTTDACDTDAGWDYSTDSACYGDLDGTADIVSGVCYYGAESCTASGCTDGTSDNGPGAIAWSACDINGVAGGSYSAVDDNAWCFDDSANNCYYDTSNNNCDESSGWNLASTTCLDPGTVSTNCYYDNGGSVDESDSCTASGCSGISSEAVPVTCDSGSFANGAMACGVYATDICYYNATDGCAADTDGWDYATYDCDAYDDTSLGDTLLRESELNTTSCASTCTGTNCCAVQTITCGSSFECNGFYDLINNEDETSNATCYYSNAGAWSWGATADASETSCTDGYDNDCDGDTDDADVDCTCSSGNDCSGTELCIGGICRAACSDTYDGSQCSPDGSATAYGSYGICTLETGSGWSCDASEAAYDGSDYLYDCSDSASSYGEQCDNNTLAGGYSVNGVCGGTSHNTCFADYASDTTSAITASSVFGTQTNVCDDEDGYYCDNVNDGSFVPGTQRCDASDNVCDACDAGTIGDDGNCEAVCGADSQCDEYSILTCPAQGYICLSTCVYTDRDNDQTYCEDSSGCTAYEWAIGGEVDAAACCGDDGTDNNIDSTYAASIEVPPALTDACCDTSTDCVNSNTCYTNAATLDVDSTGDLDVCSSGTWIDCTTVSHCDPTGENPEGDDGSQLCAGATDCDEACSSNDCIYTRKDGWGDCDVNGACTNNVCIQDGNYATQFVGTGMCDVSTGAICTGGATDSYDVCISGTQCLIDHDYDDNMADCTGSNCLISSGGTFDLDNDGDDDYCNSGTWVDCNTDSECPAGYTCTVNDCVDSTAPSCSVDSISEDSNLGYQYVSGTTIYYNTKGTGQFTVTASSTDAGSGVHNVTFPTTVSAGGADTSSAYTYQYSWDTSDTYSTTATVTCYDTDGNSATDTFVVTKDTTDPSGGSISYSGGYLDTVTITFSDGTDSDSGVNASNTRLLRRESNILDNNTCGNYGSWSQLGTKDPTSPYEDSSVSHAKCYQFRYEVFDNVLNGVNYTDSDTAMTNNEPTHDAPTITPSNPTSISNLTCDWNNVADLDSDSVTNITNWYKNNVSTTILYMPFEGGSNSTYTKDYSGYGNDGTVNGATFNRTGGKIGGAYEFDGVDDYVEVPNSASLNITNEITIEAWIKPASFTDYDAIVANFEYPTNPEGYSFRVHSDNHLVWRAVLSGDNSYSITSDSTMTIDNWYHVVLTHDASYTRLWINGNLDKEDNPGGTIVNLGKVLMIGWDDYAADRVFNGSIDEVKIYNYSLSGDQIYQNYLAGNQGRNSQILIFNETDDNEEWLCSVTPNDGYEDGLNKNSSSVIIQNNPPEINKPSFNPVSAKTVSNIDCNATPFDLDDEILTVEWYWYNGSDVKLSGNTSGLNSGVNSIITTLGFGNTTKGETWNCTVRIYDDTEYSAYNSSTIYIGNTPPGVPTLLRPSNGNTSLIYAKPTFTWTNVSNIDNDALNFTLNITSSECPNFGLFEKITALDYTLTSEVMLECNYTWQVRAYDGIEYSPWSDNFTFKIYPTIILTLINNSINFGTLSMNESADTDTLGGPFVVRNDGNVLANISWVSINQSLFTTVGGNTPYLRFKVDNSTKEPRSFNYSNSTILWTNLDLITQTNRTAIGYLNYSDTSDEAEIDINITVPIDEPPGLKSILMYIIGQES